MTSKNRPVEILLVEDNAGDVRLTVEALKEIEVANHLSVARDGVEALEFLRREGRFVQAPRPDVILLDLNMPKRDGRDVLAAIKGDPRLQRIPVIVLTTSHAEEDVARAYTLGANAYITKPVDMEQFIDFVKAIDAFWFRVATLPAGD